MTAAAKEGNPAPQWPFWAATVIYLSGLGIYCCWNAAEVLGLKPNNLGDFLAGAFSPLAFLWLLYAALAQRAELKLQRAELKLQRDELAENNRTQIRQQEEMNRQANALEAQTRRLEAESDATYKPVFVLKQVHHPEGQLLLEIENFGAGVLDAKGDGAFSLRFYFPPDDTSHSSEIRGNVLPYWGKNGRVYGYLTTNDSNRDHDVAITITRLDLVDARYSFRYVHSEGRIQAQSIETANP